MSSKALTSKQEKALVKKYQGKKKVTQRQLAQEYKIDQATVSRIIARVIGR